MPLARSLTIICAIASLNAVAFIQYQRPDWNTYWTDQGGYRQLGHILATTGKFTRNPDLQPFVPETIRTPGYPALVAVAYRAFGEDQLSVAGVQTGLFVLTCVLVFAIGSRLATPSVGLSAAALTALFPPIPYYGALIMTDVFATFLMTLAIWLMLRALTRERTRDFVLSGVVLGVTALTRPSFVLFPIAAVLALTVGLKFKWRRLLPWGWMLAAVAIVIAPWLLYNLVYVHRLAMSPAGGVGRGTWEASWQGVWPGRVQAALTKIGEAGKPPDETDAEIRAVAIDSGLPAEPMLRYIDQWRTIRKIWDIPAGLRERAAARIVADDEYWRVGVENIRRAGVKYVLRRVTVGTFVLWAGEIPIRYSEINQTPPIVIRLIWLVQVVLVVLGLSGLGLLWWRGLVAEAALLGSLLAYITAVHLPLLAEARYSLPAKPMLLLLVAMFLSETHHRFQHRRDATSPRT